MSERRLTEERTHLSYYAPLFTNNVQAGHGTLDAAVVVAEAYLDGKPRKRGKHKFTRAERDAGLVQRLPEHPAG